MGGECRFHQLTHRVGKNGLHLAANFTNFFQIGREVSPKHDLTYQNLCPDHLRIFLKSKLSIKSVQENSIYSVQATGSIRKQKSDFLFLFSVSSKLFKNNPAVFVFSFVVFFVWFSLFLCHFLFWRIGRETAATRMSREPLYKHNLFCLQADTSKNVSKYK